ncbi:MAG: DUF1761 domain-containing protein [Sporichthyaceae bacterium]|nr:DUF1761 domain-containing protein [Sporichthyaceae bacterium]
MADLNYLAVAVAAVAALIVSFAWYSVFAAQLAALHDAYAGTERPPAWKILVELVRCLVLAVVMAGFVERMDIDGWPDAVLFGLVAWVGFPVVLWTGAVIWENVPRKLAAVHLGDWLLKLVLVAFIVGVWR